MQIDLHFLLMLAATICWALAALGRPTVPAPYGVGWLGLMFFGINMLIR